MTTPTVEDSNRELLNQADQLDPTSVRSHDRAFWETLREHTARADDHHARTALMAKLMMISDVDEESVPKGMVRLMQDLRDLMA